MPPEWCLASRNPGLPASGSRPAWLLVRPRSSRSVHTNRDRLIVYQSCDACDPPVGGRPLPPQHPRARISGPFPRPGRSASAAPSPSLRHEIRVIKRRVRLRGIMRPASWARRTSSGRSCWAPRGRGPAPCGPGPGPGGPGGPGPGRHRRPAGRAGADPHASGTETDPGPAVGPRSRCGHRSGSPLPLIVRDVYVQDRGRCRGPVMSMRSMTSARTVRTHLSA
jgi:hypothetical protein